MTKIFLFIIIVKMKIIDYCHYYLYLNFFHYGVTQDFYNFVLMFETVIKFICAFIELYYFHYLIVFSDLKITLIECLLSQVLIINLLFVFSHSNPFTIAQPSR